MKQTIAVFARAPVAGRVKTRLAQHLGDEAARALYAAMLRDTLALAKRACRNLEGCQVIVAHTPDDAFEPGADSLLPFWSGARLAQCEGDIGTRMLDCIARLQGQGGAQVVLIGSDAPDLPATYISTAFQTLQQREMSFAQGQPQAKMHDLVFGPALDGGFYLIAASKPVPGEIFRDVEWSSRETLAQVKANAQRLNLQLDFLPPHGDLDTRADLRRFARRSKRLNRHRAPETWHFLLSNRIYTPAA